MRDGTNIIIADPFPAVDVDAFVVMPNHIHGIVVIIGAEKPWARKPRPRWGRLTLETC